VSTNNGEMCLSLVRAPMAYSASTATAKIALNREIDIEPDYTRGKESGDSLRGRKSISPKSKL
jgi:hypothetical protein